MRYGKNNNIWQDKNTFTKPREAMYPMTLSLDHPYVATTKTDSSALLNILNLNPWERNPEMCLNIKQPKHTT